MADIRIKDLTSPASSTASDDFIAVDGTTNGTRKLSAFSPTFGGNATVTGTLTVSGNSITGGSSGISLIASGTNQNVTLTPTGTGYVAVGSSGVAITTTGYFYGAGASGAVFHGGAGKVDIIAAGTNQNITLSASGTGVITTANPVTFTNTTASTTTSTGALVVGNGTSGGLGVGGAASIGGPILVGTSSDVYLSRTGAGVLDLRSASTPGTLGRLDINGTTSAAVGFRQTGSRDWFITAESFELRVSCLTAASIFAFNSGTPVAMRDSTASTSTSSGALVVSGGVGVAGALSIGGNVLIDKASPEVLMKRGANTDDGLLKFQTGVFGDFGIGHRGTTDSDLHIYNYGTAADALKIAKSDSLATFSAAIRTAAPSGGTAASWKLGTVATVSPTSPNRTIEVDIGGTIYYLAAKTTNN